MNDERQSQPFLAPSLAVVTLAYGVSRGLGHLLADLQGGRPMSAGIRLMELEGQFTDLAEAVRTNAQFFYNVDSSEPSEEEQAEAYALLEAYDERL